MDANPFLAGRLGLSDAADFPAGDGGDSSGGDGVVDVVVIDPFVIDSSSSFGHYSGRQIYKNNIKQLNKIYWKCNFPAVTSHERLSVGHLSFI